jgi:hypothetical protein
METNGGDAPERKRKRNIDAPPDTVVQVESHRILWEATLEGMVAKKGHNSQIFSKEKINLIISTLERFDFMTWPVRSPLYSCTL